MKWQRSHSDPKRTNGDNEMYLVEMIRHNHSLNIESDDKSTRKCPSEARRDDVSKEMGTEDGDLVDCQRLHHIDGNVGPRDQTEKTKRWIWKSWSGQFGRKGRKKSRWQKLVESYDQKMMRDFIPELVLSRFDHSRRSWMIENYFLERRRFCWLFIK